MFLKNKNIIFKIRRSKVTDYAVLSGVSLAGRIWPNIECCLGSFVITQGQPDCIAKELYSFMIFQWEGGGCGLDPRMKLRNCTENSITK